MEISYAHKSTFLSSDGERIAISGKENCPIFLNVVLLPSRETIPDHQIRKRFVAPKEETAALCVVAETIKL